MYLKNIYFYLKEWEWGARREREASYKEVENLKNGLQSLSRAANPLGKLIDYVQEDVEIMRQELLHWKDARQVSANLLNHQERLVLLYLITYYTILKKCIIFPCLYLQPYRKIDSTTRSEIETAKREHSRSNRINLYREIEYISKRKKN